MLSASRSRLCSLLLAHNGRVAKFDTTKELMLKQTGLCSGVRVRAFAGARIGQIGVAVGVRNGALWVKWGDSAGLEAISQTALPRMDLRPIDMVEVKGLDPTQYEEGDAFISPLYTSERVVDETRVTVLLDDASTQHIVNEMATRRPCQRCTERHEKHELRTAVENLNLEHSFCEEIIRVLGLEMPGEPRLYSKKSIFEHLTKLKQVREYESMSDVDILAKVLAKRMALFHDLSTVRVLTNEFKLPNAILRPIETKHRISNSTFAARIPTIHNLLGEEVTLTGWEGVVQVKFTSSRDHVKDAAVALIQISEKAAPQNEESTVVFNLRDELIPGKTETGIEWLTAALLMGSGRLATVSGVLAFKEKAKGEGKDPVAALMGELTARLKILENMKEVTLQSGDTIKIPSEVITSSTSEVQVIDAPWCREIVATHKQLNAFKALEAASQQDSEEPSQPTHSEAYGKFGTVTATTYIGKGVTPQAVERQVPVAKGLLYELSLFRGRHMEPNIPEADVFILEGRYNYLDKACAKELFQGVEDAPVLYDARGRAEYKTNAYHQPFNMVNERGLEQFAPQAKTGGRYNRKSVFTPHTSPSPMGR